MPATQQATETVALPSNVDAISNGTKKPTDEICVFYWDTKLVWDNDTKEGKNIPTDSAERYIESCDKIKDWFCFD
jgi:hypothetical protein